MLKHLVQSHFFLLFLIFSRFRKKRQKHILETAIVAPKTQQQCKKRFWYPSCKMSIPTIFKILVRLIGSGSSVQAHWSGYPAQAHAKRWARGKELPPHARSFCKWAYQKFFSVCAKPLLTNANEVVIVKVG